MQLSGLDEHHVGSRESLDWENPSDLARRAGWNGLGANEDVPWVNSIPPSETLSSQGVILPQNPIPTQPGRLAITDQFELTVHYLLGNTTSSMQGANPATLH